MSSWPPGSRQGCRSGKIPDECFQSGTPAARVRLCLRGRQSDVLIGVPGRLVSVQMPKHRTAGGNHQQGGGEKNQRFFSS